MDLIMNDQLDLVFIKNLDGQQYDTAMVCIDAFSKYADAVPIRGKSENGLALGMLESIAKMGKTTQVVYLDAEPGVRNSGLFHKYFTWEHDLSPFYNRTWCLRWALLLAHF